MVENPLTEISGYLNYKKKTKKQEKVQRRNRNGDLSEDLPMEGSSSRSSKVLISSEGHDLGSAQGWWVLRK